MEREGEKSVHTEKESFGEIGGNGKEETFFLILRYQTDLRHFSRFFSSTAS